MARTGNKTPRRATRKSRIAILGATSHIAKGLINNFLSRDSVRLFLFARNARPVPVFLKETVGTRGGDVTIIEGYRTFSEKAYDLIINCIGLGTVSEEPHIYTSFFMVTERFDNLVISYLKKSPRTVYINFSSGAVYGTGFPTPANAKTINEIPVNGITRDNYFAVAKLNSEAKHRAFETLNIIDIRVFSYFSRFVDITGKYFLTELLHCLVQGKVFITGEENIARDYIHPDDLFLLIKKCLARKKINVAIDAYSLRPAKKKEILEYFASRYGLKYAIEKSAGRPHVTGHKSVYYSLFKKAAELNYRPRFSSMVTIQQESAYLLQNLLLDHRNERTPAPHSAGRG